MNYCKWGDNNWKCDVWCYTDDEGHYITNVAKSHYPFDFPEINIQLLVAGKYKEYMKEYHANLDAVLNVQTRLEPIGLPYDGQQYTDDDLHGFMDRLLWLKEKGYRVPDFVFKKIAACILAETKEFCVMEKLGK